MAVILNESFLLFLVHNWSESASFRQVPVRAEVQGFNSKGQFILQSPGQPYSFHHIYEYFDFRTELWEDESVFEVSHFHYMPSWWLIKGTVFNNSYVPWSKTLRFPVLVHLRHLSWWAIVIVGCPRCVVCRVLWVVCRQQLLQRTSPPKLFAGFSSNLAGMILTWPSLIIVQMVLVHWISRSLRLK